MKALLVEDNVKISNLIASGIKGSGFEVDRAFSLAEAEEIMGLSSFDLIILDLNLPDGDGIAWLKKIRRWESCANIPVIVATARSDLDDRIVGLDTGADDYIVKPFEIGELLARMRAVLRRPGRGLSAVLSVGNIEFDAAAWRLTVCGQMVALSRREMALLQILLTRVGQVVARESLEQSLYSADAEFTPNALEVLVSRLRRRLGDAMADVSIHTIRGVGYLLRWAQP